MSLRCNIDVLTGHASGLSREFDQDVITIGREAACDVRLHPTLDVAVGRGTHARIRRKGDEWLIESVHESGVSVRSAQGERRLGAGESEALRESVVIEVGHGGPSLRVTSLSELPATERQAHAGGVLPVARVPSSVIEQAETSHRRTGKLAVAVLALAMVGAATAALLVNKTRSVERSVLQSGQLSKAQLDQLTSLLGGSDVGAPSKLADVLRSAAESVWVVGAVDDNGRFLAVGTAWTVAPDRLATNAHVAEELERVVSVGGLKSAVARKAAIGGPELQLAAVGDIHPGYAQWGQRYATQFGAGVGGRTQLLGFIPACDVAVLHIAAGDPGRPLPLLPGAVTKDLVGRPIGYVGYPMEGLPGFPSLQTMTGSVTAVTTFFFERGSAEDACLIHHNAVTLGGASGSPLMSADGYVVGLVSAGASVGATELGRIPIGVNYAQRADLLDELLRGEAGSAQQARSESWDTAAKALFLPPDQLMASLLRDVLGKFGEPQIVESESVRLVDAGVNGGKSFELELEPGFYYCIGAASESGVNVDLAAIVLDSGDTTSDSLPNWFPVLKFDASGKARPVAIVVYAPDVTAPVTVELTVARCRAY